MSAPPRHPYANGRDISRLLAIMAALRTPVTGCPWDLEQTFTTIAPYTIEEAYEVADAIERGEMSDLCEELGDLLLQVVYHSRIAEEGGLFCFDDVVETVSDKMFRRHPHVFGDEEARSADRVGEVWARIKTEERAKKQAERNNAPALSSTLQTAIPETSALSGVPSNMPALTRAVKLQTAAGRVGFDWNDPYAVLAKIREETDEIEAELKRGDLERQAAECGDLLFAVANLARHLKLDPESALRRTNTKFIRRFLSIETALAADGRTPEQSDLAEMDALWNAAKRDESDEDGV